MYKCDGTVRSTKSVNTTAGMTMAGKSMAASGEVSNQPIPGAARAVMNHTVDAPIGGTLAFSQVDAWIDKSLNNRASVNMWVSNGVALVGGNLDCRPSSRDQNVLVVTFSLSRTFTNPDLKLSYLVDRVTETYALQDDKNQAMKILQNHPRYIAKKLNLQSLLGSRNDKAYIVEYRIRVPFAVADELVTSEEDKVFYGHHIETDDETGENHIHFELKERKKIFKPVVVDGVAHACASVARVPGQRKSMFATAAVKMAPIAEVPGSIQFASPNPRLHKQDDDDGNSTIASDEKKPKAVEKLSFLPDEEEDEDDWQPAMEVEETVEVEVADKTDVDELKKEVANLLSIVTGMAQQNTGQVISPVSTPKKKKENDGTATSVAGSTTSRRSNNTRGSAARSAKRKGKKKPSTADGNGSDTDSMIS